MNNTVIEGRWGEPERARPTDGFTPFTPCNWARATPPQLSWMVEGCFLRGTVAILAGDGGLGKSLLMQQLQTACALGRPWLGLETAQCKSLAVYCEDDPDELHRRQSWINQHYGCAMEDLDGVNIESRAGRDCVLMRFHRGFGDSHEITPMMAHLRRAVRDTGAQIVILDTLADVFAGNEIDRNQPRTFIRPLRQLAIAIQGVVILTQHPSNEGVASGTGMSGSRGWNNSVRSRLYLTAPKKKGEDEPSPNERLLKTMKSNAGPNGGKIKLRWNRGVFVRDEEESRAYYMEQEREWV